MFRVRRQAHAAALMLTVGLAGASAGCGSGGDPPTVASAASPRHGGADERDRGPGRAVRRGASEPGSGAFVSRASPDVPDPDAKGHVDLSAHGGRAKTEPRWMAAQKSCRQFNIEVPAELEPKLPPLTAEQLAWRREYAACMRANGMPRWPDPGADGEWPENMLPGELTAQEQANNIRALQICDPVMQGRPPTTPDPRNTGQG